MVLKATETIGSCRKEEEKLELPPGFRFHPTDEELITHYLSQKVLDCSFISRAIGDVDLNKCEPWDLPWKAKMGEREWYFFCVRDRKYPTGLRTNRATDAGYWKATGKDKEIYKQKMVVGMKKTLVFYKGRAPKGEKTNWVMHEFRLEGKFSVYNFPKTTKNEWVICRVFQKTTGGKKIPITCLIRSILPPLTDAGGDASHVTCFSGAAEEDQKPTQGHVITNTTTAQHIITTTPINSFYNPNLEYPDSIFAQDQTLLRMLCDNNNVNSTNMNMVMMMRSDKEEFSPGAMSTDMSSVVSNLEMVQRQFEEQDEPSTSGAPVDLDCLWNY